MLPGLWNSPAEARWQSRRTIRAWRLAARSADCWRCHWLRTCDKLRRGSQSSQFQCLQRFRHICQIDQNHVLAVIDVAEARGGNASFAENIVRFLSDVLE